MIVKVTREALEEIQAATAEAGQREACGLLLGEKHGANANIALAVETRNAHPTPETHFEVDPQALIDTYRSEREGGPALIGYFHSHPNGAPAPSPTDQDMAPGDGRIWAIASRDEVRFWRDGPEGFTPVTHHIVEL